MTRNEQLLRDALELGLEAAEQVAFDTHEKFKGYKPQRHAAVDADVEKIKAAIAILAATSQQAEREPVGYLHRHGNHTEVSERRLEEGEIARGWAQEPIYTAPPPAQQEVAEVKRLRQGLWDVYAELGCDTDGDKTPDALVSDIVALVLDAAKEARRDYDEAIALPSPAPLQAEPDLAEMIRAKTAEIEESMGTTWTYRNAADIEAEACGEPLYTPPAPQAAVPSDISKRLREHDDPRLYREADVLMHEAANEIDRLGATPVAVSDKKDEFIAEVMGLSIEHMPVDMANLGPLDVIRRMFKEHREMREARALARTAPVVAEGWKLDFRPSSETPTELGDYILYNQCDGYHIVEAWFDDGVFSDFWVFAASQPVSRDFYCAWAKLPDSLKDLYPKFAKDAASPSAAQGEGT